MKCSPWLLLLLVVSALAGSAQSIPSELRTPKIVSVNRMPMRAAIKEILDYARRLLLQLLDKAIVSF